MAGDYKIATKLTDPYSLVSRIYDLKGDWAAADSDDKRQDIAKKAQPYYAQLRSNGFGDVADQLAASDHNQAKYIKDYYAKSGKTATRPYLYSLGKRYGMSEGDVDKLISWDNNTGEISFGGKNIGKPDAVSTDGTSYWRDTAPLDTAMREHVAGSGTTEPTSLKWNDTMDESQRKGKEAFDRVLGYADSGLDKSRLGTEQLKRAFDYSDQDVTKTAEFKGIYDMVMPAYEYDADKAGTNAAASGAAGNGGNVDSFSAANARRQRESSLAKGQSLAAQLGLNAYLNRSGEMRSNAQNTMSASGTDANNAYTIAGAGERLREGDRSDAAELRQGMNDEVSRNETSANGKVNRDEATANGRINRDAAIATIKGQVTSDLLYSGNPYFNPDGTLRSTDIDYKEVIQNAEASGDKRTADYARQARLVKILGDYDRWSQYLDSDVATPDQMDTEEKRAAVAEDLLSRYLGNLNANTTIQTNAADNATTRAVTEMTNASNERINTANNKNALDQLMMQYGLNTDGSALSSTLDDASVKNWVKTLNNSYKGSIVEDSPGRYKVTGNKAAIILKVAGSADLTDAQKKHLLTDVLGVSSDDIATVVSAYSSGRDSEGRTIR